MLAVDNLAVRFPGQPGPPSLSGVTFEIREGEAVAVVGRSGSGKSILLRALTGMLDHADVTFDRLRLRVDGRDRTWTVTGREAYTQFQRQVRPLLASSGFFFFQDAMNQLHPLRGVVRQLLEERNKRQVTWEVCREGKQGVGLFPLVDRDPEKAWRKLEW